MVCRGAPSHCVVVHVQGAFGAEALEHVVLVGGVALRHGRTRTHVSALSSVLGHFGGRMVHHGNVQTTVGLGIGIVSGSVSQVLILALIHVQRRIGGYSAQIKLFVNDHGCLNVALDASALVAVATSQKVRSLSATGLLCPWCSI